MSSTILSPEIEKRVTDYLKKTKKDKPVFIVSDKKRAINAAKMGLLIIIAAAVVAYNINIFSELQSTVKPF